VVIGIVGLGSVGTAVYEGLRIYHDVHGYDIDGRGDWNRIMKSDALFICVPTEGTTEGVLDSGIVEEVVSRISSNDEYDGLIIVKSTLQPGSTSRLHSLFPALRIVYMPEFLREKDAKEWFQNPDRLVAAGSPEDVNEAWSYFEWVPKSIPRLVMTCLEAEIGKLAHNSYIATKVTFTCEVERLCRTFDADPRPVMEIVWRDRRVKNPAHLTPGLGGFDGKCVPKDTQALRSMDIDTPLLDTVCETGNNIDVKKKMAEISSRSINPVNEKLYGG
jgi:UDPglucose 6-dehydrogenase|tara:strand:- start:3 stop:824 length:822 start_codon:yes stop_codon:yes gene_type:complete